MRATLGGFWIVLGLVIAALQYLANAYYLYYRWWWSDVVMHFLGGLFIGVGVLWWLRFEIPIGIRTRIPRFATAFLLVLLVGVSWEIFEWYTNSYNATNYVLDTASDILMDVCGMLAAYLVFLRYDRS